MNQKVKKIFIAFLLSIVFFVTFVKLFVDFGDQVFGLSYTRFLYDRPQLLLVFYLGVTLLFFINLLQLLNVRINKVWLKGQFIGYLIIVGYMLLFKSEGVRGVNLNPFNLVEFKDSPLLLVILNTLVFIPLGSYFYIKFKSLKTTLIVALAIVMIIETGQYIFSLGIFDVYDILTNVFGFYLGYTCFDIIYDWGIRGESTDKEIVFKNLHNKKEKDKEFHNENQ